MTTQVQTTQNAAADAARELPVVQPAVDVYEKADAILLLMDVPGVDKQAVRIQVERDSLTVEADQAGEALEGYQLLHREARPVRFRRTFSLNREIDRDRIEANLQQGVLRLTLPKTAEAQPRRIEVKAEG